MKDLKSTLIMIGVVLLIFFIIFGSGWWIGRSGVKSPMPQITTKTDTVTVTIRDTITFTKHGKNTTTVIRDTMLVLAGDTTKPDTLIITEKPKISSCFDTLLTRPHGLDSLYICYYYPENQFKYTLKGQTDYISISNQTQTLAIPPKNYSAWWCAGGFVGGVIVTILVRNLIK